MKTNIAVGTAVRVNELCGVVAQVIDDGVGLIYAVIWADSGTLSFMDSAFFNAITGGAS